MDYTGSYSPAQNIVEQFNDAVTVQAAAVKRKLELTATREQEDNPQTPSTLPADINASLNTTEFASISATPSPLRDAKTLTPDLVADTWVATTVPSSSSTGGLDFTPGSLPSLLTTAADSNGTAELPSLVEQSAKKLKFQKPPVEHSAPVGGSVEKWDPARSMASLRHEFGEHGGVNMSIENSATFTVMNPEQMTKIFKGEVGPDDDAFVYSRHYNPTVMHLGKQLAALEGTEAGYCTASGMAAISAALLQLTNNGDNIVASNRLYGGSYALLAHFMPKKCGITTSFVDITDVESVERAIVASSSTKVLFFESLSNPTLVVADIPKLVEVAHRHGVKVVVDNTFAPVLLTPARLGADVIVHSISKFISGGSDIIAGCVCGPSKMIAAMMDLMEGPFMIMGATMNPQVAFQLSTRLPHLPLRMKEHGVRAAATAQVLQESGLSVAYPGLPSHPQHELFKSMLNEGYGSGGMLSVDLKTSEGAYQFMDHLQNGTQFGFMAVSLGFHDTLMSCSGASTSSEMGSEQLAAVGISPGLVRVSVGFTGGQGQRLSQLRSALAALRHTTKVGG